VNKKDTETARDKKWKEKIQRQKERRMTERKQLRETKRTKKGKKQ